MGAGTFSRALRSLGRLSEGVLEPRGRVGVCVGEYMVMGLGDCLSSLKMAPISRMFQGLDELMHGKHLEHSAWHHGSELTVTIITGRTGPQQQQRTEEGAFSQQRAPQHPVRAGPGDGTHLAW